MSTAAAMTIMIAILAVLLLGFFATVWLKDRDRNKETSSDSARQHTDTDGRGSSGPTG
jgi:hypothetical protein